MILPRPSSVVYPDFPKLRLDNRDKTQRCFFSRSKNIFVSHTRVRIKAVHRNFAGPSIIIWNFCRSRFGSPGGLCGIWRFSRLVDTDAPRTLFSLDQFVRRSSRLVGVTQSTTWQQKTEQRPRSVCIRSFLDAAELPGSCFCKKTEGCERSGPGSIWISLARFIYNTLFLDFITERTCRLELQ